MKNTKEVMSIGKYMFLSYVVDGAGWLIAGIFSAFRNLPCMIICLISLSVAFYATSKASRAETEEDDEMSLQHLQEARAITQVRVYRLISIIAVVLLFMTRLPIMEGVEWRIILIPILYILLGVNGLSVGLTFKKLEEE